MDTMAECNGKYSHKDIEALRNKINNTDSSHHGFILKIIKNYGIDFSENRNGCFVNLLNVPEKALRVIEQHVNFLYENEENLKELETLKEDIQHNSI